MEYIWWTQTGIEPASISLQVRRISNNATGPNVPCREYHFTLKHYVLSVIQSEGSVDPQYMLS
jgi:hypothetical protein